MSTGHTPSNLAHVCRIHHDHDHDHVHAHPAESYAAGWLIPSWEASP